MKILNNTKIFEMPDVSHATGLGAQTISHMIRKGEIEPADAVIGTARVWGEQKFRAIEEKFRNRDAA